MKFPKKVDIDVNEDFYDRIKVKQNDTARYLLFNLLDNRVPFSLENKTVRVYGVKPDGTKVFNNLTIINAARGLAELQLTTQMLVKPGCLKLELVIYEATDILSTTKFDIDIISCLRDDAAIESTNEFSALTLGLSKLDEWDKYFKETSGKIEEKYTERLNGIDSSLEEKVNKEQGKGLSTYDYNGVEKAQVATIKDRATKEEVASVKAQVANIIANNPNTEGNTELIDVRTGANGKVYGSAGQAVREQFADNNTEIKNIRDTSKAYVYISNNGRAYFKKVSGNQYTLELTDSLSIIHPSLSSGMPFSITKEQFIEFIPNNAQIVGNGVSITVPNYNALVYSLEEQKIKLVTFNKIKNEHIIICSNAWENYSSEIANNSGLKDSYFAKDGVIDLLSTVKCYPYIGDSGKAYFKKVNGNQYTLELTSGITVYIPKLSKVVELQAIKFEEDIPNNVTVNGKALSITIPSYQALVYNIGENKIKFKHHLNLTYDDVVLAYNSWENYASPLVNNNLFKDVYSHNEEIVNIKDEIEGIKNNTTSLPVYYKEEIERVRKKIMTLNSDNFNMLVFTDIHYSHTDFTSEMLSNMMTSIENIANTMAIDCVAFLGDLIEGGVKKDKNTSISQIYDVVKGLKNVNKPVMWAFGNHDNNSFNYASGGATKDNYILTNEYTNICPKTFGNNKDYYYRDINRIRVIVTNSCDYKEIVDETGNITIPNYSESMTRKEQLNAIGNWLLESPNDIIICSHSLSGEIMGMCREFNRKGSFQYNGSNSFDFSGVTHKVLLYSCGHYHNDALEYVTDYSLPVISTGCSSMAKVQQSVAPIENYPTILKTWVQDKNKPETILDRTHGTINECLFDIVSIGKNSVDRIRFGSGEDKIITY